MYTLQQIYDRYFTLATKMSKHYANICGPSVDYRDYTTIALISVYEKQGKYNPEILRFDYWVAHMLSSKLKHLYRKDRHYRIKNIQPVNIENRSLTVSVDKVIAYTFLMSQINCLPKSYQEIFYRKYWLDETLEQIAQHTNSHASNVWSKHKRGLKILRQRMTT